MINMGIKVENTRELVLDMLMEITEGGEYSHKVISQVLEKYDYLDGQDKAFIKRVTEGTIERQLQLDYVIDSVSSVPVRKMKPLIRSLMRMSAYQLLFMDAIPDSAVCNEAVKLAGKRRFHNLKGFVNGVLRNLARKKDSISYPDKKSEPVKALSVLYSCPEWIVEMWIADYGLAKTETILQGLLEIHPVTVRIEESLDDAGRESVLAELRQKAKEVSVHPYLPYAVTLRGIEGLNQLSAFREGKITVQDVSSMLAVEAAGIKAGDLVLDVCAAPGGKSFHAACKTGPAGQVLARDVSEKKTDLLYENKKRLQKDWVKIARQDAAVLDESMIESADVVLADVPCSGLGILGKKRDIKYRVSEESLREVTVLQRAIIDTVWQYVKPGGVLLYSTCTIHREENQDMVDYIVGNYPFAAESLEPYLPEVLHGETVRKGYLQMLPGVEESDGFFIARFRRRG